MLGDLDQENMILKMVLDYIPTLTYEKKPILKDKETECFHIWLYQGNRSDALSFLKFTDG